MDLKLTIATAPGESTTVLVECATVEEGLARMHRIIGGMRPPKREPLRDSWSVTGFTAAQLGGMSNVPDHMKPGARQHQRKGDPPDVFHSHRRLVSPALDGPGSHRRIDDPADSRPHLRCRR